MKQKDVLKGSVVYMAAPIGTALITLFIIPVVSYYFPEAEFGRINMFYSMGMVLSNVFLLGFDHALIRFFFEPNDGASRGAMIVIALFCGLGCDALFLALELVLIGPWVSNLLFGETSTLALVLLSVYIAGLIVFRVLNVVARARGEALRYNVQCILQNLVTRASFIIIVAYTTDYRWAIMVMTIGMVVFPSLFFIIQYKELNLSDGLPNKNRAYQLLAFGIPCMINTLVITLNSSIGKFILSGRGLFEEVGVLAIATTLSTAFSIIPQAFGTYWSPFMYKNYKNEQTLIKSTHDWIMLLSIIIVVGIMLFQDVLFLLVGHGYKQSQTYFMLLMLGPVQTLICETTGYGTMLANKPIITTVIFVLGVVTNFIIDMITIPLFGGLGVGIGVAVSSVLMGLARTMVGQKYYLSIHSTIRTVIASLLIITICAVNTFVYSSITIRIFLCCGVVAFTALLYKKQIAEVGKYVFKLRA